MASWIRIRSSVNMDLVLCLLFIKDTKEFQKKFNILYFRVSYLPVFDNIKSFHWPKICPGIIRIRPDQ
jgi:hypothetical protein